jgi:hypothetical protein
MSGSLRADCFVDAITQINEGENSDFEWGLGRNLVGCFDGEVVVRCVVNVVFWTVYLEA